MRRTCLVPAALPILLAPILLTAPGSALAQAYNGVQAFGDSPTDNGNLYALRRAATPRATR